MFAFDRGRKAARALMATVAAAALAPQDASAQLGNYLRGKSAPPAAAPAPAAPASAPALKEVRLPANGSDAIAIVNGEPITRQQLADECVAREGQKILDTLIARRLIEQAIKAKKMEITAVEIDAEIESVAQNVGHVSREIWLRTLDKERGISPATYARDIIFPSIALRKLAEPRVQVTEQDLKDAFEANFGPRLRCRMILTDKVHTANLIWEELRKNPAGFEKIAQERSMDAATRSMGGLMPEPMARHAYPRNVSDAAFTQLVDGDPADTNKSHKPKDGDFTGPIQVNDNAWVIVRREGVGSARSGSLNDPDIRGMLHAQMFDVKLKEAMNSVYEDMMKASSIDNRLTGTVKERSEEQSADFRASLDGKVKLMNHAGETAPTTLPSSPRSVTPASTSPAGASRPPAGVPPAAANAARTLQQTIQAAPPGGPRN